MLKIKRFTIILTILILLLVCHVSSEAKWTYVLANMIYGSNAMNNGNILFSKESGFYDDEFVLRIYAPTNEIYYTLDDS